MINWLKIVQREGYAATKTVNALASAPNVPRTCGTCLHWMHGHCHENSPGIGRQGQAIWPRSFGNDTCGKWQARRPPTYLEQTQ